MSEGVSGIEKCFLRSRNYKYCDINLPHNMTVIVGRGRETKIRERRCSKNQVEITANYATRTATVKQLGGNPSEIDDKLLFFNNSVEVSDGSSINLIQDHLKYTLEFKANRDCLLMPAAENSSHTVETKWEMCITSGESSKRETDCDTSSSKKVKHSGGNDILSSDNIRENVSEQNTVRDSLAEDLVSLSTVDRWEEYDHSKLLVYTSASLKGKSKIAAFDMDHTLICTKSGKVFPVDTYDWRIMYSEIPGKLKELHQAGYKLVIFTNQKGISKGKTYVPDFKKKILNIVKKLGVPMQVFISTGSGRYRKPNTGMWDYFVQKGNQDVPIDVMSSLYVGDAAGRVENWACKKKKDFSCADRLFALNLQLQFYTPEEFFLGQKQAVFCMPNFDPRSIGNCPLAVRYKPPPEDNIDENNISSKSLEVIVLVGFPGSGKSHFAQTYLIPKGYIHINRDVLGTWQKCVSECSKALSQGKSVVIDNTNPDQESRARYIQCARQVKAPCRCFLFNCSLDQARHNNRFRQLQNPDAKHAGVNDMVMNSYKGKYKEPTLQEGFSEILRVNFVPKFKNKQEEMLYKKFLLEK